MSEIFESVEEVLRNFILHIISTKKIQTTKNCNDPWFSCTGKGLSTKLGLLAKSVINPVMRAHNDETTPKIKFHHPADSRPFCFNI